MISYLKEMTLQQTIYLTITTTSVLGLYKLKCFEFANFGLIVGFVLLLAYSVSEMKVKNGIGT